MPTYNMKNTNTGEVIQKIMSISEMESMKESGDWEVAHLSTPKLVTHTGNIVNKTSSDWKDLLKKIDKGSGKNTTLHY